MKLRVKFEVDGAETEWVSSWEAHALLECHNRVSPETSAAMFGAFVERKPEDRETDK